MNRSCHLLNCMLKNLVAELLPRGFVIVVWHRQVGTCGETEVL